MRKLKEVMLIAFFCAITINYATAQEAKISAKKISPSIIQNLDKDYHERGKTKFYVEKKNDSLYIEANFKFKNQNHSLIFDKNGNLKEVEIEIKWNELSDSIKKVIENKLLTKYNSFKITKIQIVNPRSLNALYEINIKSKGNAYEVFFDKEGKIINYKELEFSPINTQF